MSIEYFESVLERARATQRAKDHDYSGAVRLAGYREGERLLVPRGERMPAWFNVLLRLTEKYARLIEIVNLESSGGERSVDESIEQTALDMMIGLGLMLELRAEKAGDDAASEEPSVDGMAVDRPDDRIFIPMTVAGAARCSKYRCDRASEWINLRTNLLYCPAHKNLEDYVDQPK